VRLPYLISPTTELKAQWKFLLADLLEENSLVPFRQAEAGKGSTALTSLVSESRALPMVELSRL
jgi:hypothetical protein